MEPLPLSNTRLGQSLSRASGAGLGIELLGDKAALIEVWCFNISIVSPSSENSLQKKMPIPTDQGFVPLLVAQRVDRI